MTRRNPKKDKTARRRRPGPGASAQRQARLRLSDIYQLITAMPPAALPLVATTSLWLWNLAEERAPAAHCITGCLTVHHALAQYGIRSRVEAVSIAIEGSGSRPGAIYGQHPGWHGDGTFNGHTVLVVTGAGRFIDPTIQQFAEIPDTRQAMLPLQAPLPVPGGLGDQPIPVGRRGHTVVYGPLPGPLRQAWRSPAIDARTADLRMAGMNLAAHTLAMLQTGNIRPRALQAPYPRFQSLLAAIEGTELVTGGGGFRFRDPATGREFSLPDVP